MLGRGGQGIVGHWAYDGPDRDTKGGLVDIVVKQATASNRSHTPSGLSDEAAMLRLLNTANSRHIIRMYRRLYEERGHDTMEYDYRKVHRIFLEYCPGGDFLGWQRNKIDK